jgi:hypothetical protein
VIANPEIWKFTDVAEARPLIVCAAVITCFGSISMESFAGTGTSVAMDTPLRFNVYVCGEAEVFTTRIDVTMTVVSAGAV